MRIGIDCRTILNPAVGEKAGIGHYTYHLVKNLLALDRLDDFVLFFDARARGVSREFLEPNTKIKFFPFSAQKRYLPVIYSHVLAASALRSENLAVYHAPATIVPLGYRRPYVLTIHDLAIYRQPELFPRRQGFAVKYVVPRTIAAARRVIAVSEATKRDVQEFFSIPNERIATIPEGVDQDRFGRPEDAQSRARHLLNTYKIRSPYVLFVGTLEPRKNLIRLIEAWYRLVSEHAKAAAGHQLVIVGSPGWLYDEIFEEVEDRDLAGQVVFPGYIPDSDLPRVYAGATAFVYPSLYEGFGLPVLEAFASGVPVITSNSSSLPEVAGNAALLVDPVDTEGMTQALYRLLTEPGLRQELISRGRQRARGFTWRHTAEQTLEVYKQVAGV